jgi:integrase/recombinase XerD
LRESYDLSCSQIGLEGPRDHTHDDYARLDDREHVLEFMRSYVIMKMVRLMKKSSGGVKEKAVQEQIDGFLRYLGDKKGYSDNTIAAYRNDLSQFIAFLNQTMRRSVSSWADVDDQIVHSYGEYLDEQPYAPSTVARKVASVKSFFSYLVETSDLTDNPTTTLSAPKVEKRLPRILSVEEVERLLAEPAKGTTPKALRDQALLELLYATGMRVSEVVTLRLEDLDMAETRVLCVGRDGKTRQLPLTPRATESLSIYLERGRDALLQDRTEPILFVNQRGRPLTRQGLWLIIKSYAEAGDLGSNITPHTLRHSCAAHRLAQGTEPYEVRELLGHANIATTQAYMNIVSPPVEESDTATG